MALRPGEENVATLFADVHYFYSPPEHVPRHHRFDAGSYVYLFENANERRCRVEIANHPGTDHQDAFDGFLDQTNVSYSYKHSCKVSIQVADSVDQHEWHLPTYDPRNENKYHYKLHSLDIYFWMQQDALSFVNGVRRVLPPAHVEVLDEPGPPPPQQSGMSSVVQQLEKVAIEDSHHSAPPQSHTAPQDFAPPLSGPPPSKSTQPAASFTPVPYNPAAPAAPEQIQHREKTPPPPEDPLNPVAVAVAYDYQKQPFTPGLSAQFAHYPQGLASPGLQPPIATPGMTHFAPPPQGQPFQQIHPGMHRAATMPAFSHAQPAGGTGPFATGLPQPQPQQHYQQISSHQSTPLPPPSQPPHQATPPGGYSTYSYGQNAGTQADPGWATHSQAYRPTQSESQGYHGKEPKTKIEEGVGRLEKGVSGMLKKFEKKFG